MSGTLAWDTKMQWPLKWRRWNQHVKKLHHVDIDFNHNRLPIIERAAFGHPSTRCRIAMRWRPVLISTWHDLLISTSCGLLISTLCFDKSSHLIFQSSVRAMWLPVDSKRFLNSKWCPGKTSTSVFRFIFQRELDVVFRMRFIFRTSTSPLLL